MKTPDLRIEEALSSQVPRVPGAFPPLMVEERTGKVLFEPINAAQYAYITATEPNLWFWGNRGSGKSVTARWTAHARAMAFPGYRYAILRTSFPELIKNHLIYLTEEMRQLGGTFNNAKFIAYYPNGSKGFYMQATTEAEARNALGIEIMEVVFDEAPTFKWDHIVMISSSVRVPPDSGLVPLKRLLGNPLGPCIDDIWRYFIDKDVDPDDEPDYRPDEWRSIEIDHRDNTKLDIDTYRRQLGAGLPVHIRKAWLDGEKHDFGQLFEVSKTRNGKPYHLLPELPRIDGQPVVRYDEVARQWVHPEWVRIYRSIDFGFWPDPSVVLWFAVIGRRCICFKEIVRYKLVAEDLAKEIVQESRGMRIVTSYCDPSMDIADGADIVTIRGRFERNGVPLDPSVNNREYFATALNSALQTEAEPGVPTFQMYQPGCPYLVKSLPQMRYDEKHALALARHRHDHAPVAAAYFFMAQVPSTQPHKVQQIPRWMKPMRAPRRWPGRTW